MKRTVLVGAGQFGRAAVHLLDPDQWEICAFADNHPDNWDRTAVPPVLPLPEALDLHPDAVMITMKGEERFREVSAQLRRMGWKGEILDFSSRTAGFSLRSGVLKRIAERIHAENIPGAAAEFGVYRGDFARQINAAFPDRKLYLFDSFEGFPESALEEERKNGYSGGEIQDFRGTRTKEVLARMPRPEQVIIRKGVFPESAEGVEASFCFVSLDADLYRSTLDGLMYFYPRMESGGVILLHDYSGKQYAGVREAVREYEKRFGRLPLLPLPDLHGTAVILKI